MPLLSSRERTIFEMKKCGLSDGQIGEKLNIARETVNRVLGRIKQKARNLKR